MALTTDLVGEIMRATAFLVEQGLADDQNFPYENQVSATRFLVSWTGATGLGDILRSRPYVETYAEAREGRLYNVRMLDGALMQISYEVDAGALLRSRLAFLPAPDLLEFQNNAEIYLEEVLYADVVDKRVVTVPLRIDYDARPGIAQTLTHPVSHLTLGQYGSCRIATSSPMTPYLFVEFILRAFYNNAVSNIAGDLPAGVLRFPECIEAAERSLVHLGVPGR